MPREWRLRVQDILDSIGRIQRYTNGLHYEDLAEDEETLDAVERNLITLGEAALYVPEEVREKYPEIPWSSMRGMRNVAAHRYFGMDSVKQNLPPLAPKLRRILDEES